MRRREQLQTIRDRIRTTRTGRLTLQIAVALLGLVVVLIGIVLIPFPGPGWLIVIGGLAIWAIEFVWAQRLLTFTKGWLEKWWRWLRHQHWAIRVLAGAIGLVIVGFVLWISLRYSFGIRSLDDLWDYITSH
jgi:uncharacterized protein (TIGR02611 family)